MHPSGGADQVRLRDVEAGDLPVFFEHQDDPVANRMAAFPARDRDTFIAHWTANVLGDDSAMKKTILFEERVVGNILCFEREGETMVGYWIGRDHWGKGIASRALPMFLADVDARPIRAHVAKHNIASIRVLEKSGFVVESEGVVDDADGPIEEIVLLLSS